MDSKLVLKLQRMNKRDLIQLIGDLSIRYGVQRCLSLGLPTDSYDADEVINRTLIEKV